MTNLLPTATTDTLARRAPRRHATALCAVALAAAAALGGCAGLGGPASASLGRAASWQVAGPMTAEHVANRATAPSCYDGPSRLVDDCGPFARYEGP